MTGEQYKRRYDPRSPLLVPYLEHLPSFNDGSDSPRHFLERCLSQIDEWEGSIKAFVCLDVDSARRAADDSSVRFKAGRPRSSLDGMPVGVKDVIETRRLPTQLNSPIFKDFRPRRDAACIIALQDAGAVVVGKTVTAEFACGTSGPTRNPFDATRTPGGSSNGSAAAIGGGMLSGALGTQSQASVIRPASYCGAYAVKPSFGLLSLDGVAPLAPTLDHLGIFGASLADVWAILAVLAVATPGFGAPPPEITPHLPRTHRPKALIRLDTLGWGETDGESKRAFDDAMATMRKNGVKIIDRHRNPSVERLEDLLQANDSTSERIYAYEAQWPLKAYADCGSDLVGERVKDLVAIADGTSRDDYERAVDYRNELRQLVASLCDECDGFISLASSGPAPRDIAYTGSRSFAVPWTMVAGPAVSLPVLASDGLPLGIQVMGQRNSDQSLGGIARWIAESFLT